MKRFLLISVLAIILSSTAQAVQDNVLSSKIELAKLKEKLQLVNCEKSPLNVYACDLKIPGEPLSALVGIEVHGKHSNDADKIVVGCSRFDQGGNAKKPEDLNTPCGKIYESTLSVFVERSRELIASLMEEAKRMGKENSRSKKIIQDYIFEYDVSGILIIRRASRVIN